MRPTRHINSARTMYSHTVRKKRHKSLSTLRCTPGVSILDLENINEVLRVNRIHVRNQRADGSWKVVPKDSCEVYKERRKKKAKTRRDEDGDTEMQTESDDTSVRNKQNEKKGKRGCAKKTRRRRKPKHRCSENSSLSSLTTATSCMSSSDMDYD